MHDTPEAPPEPDVLREAIELVAAVLGIPEAGVGEGDGIRTLPQWDSLKTILLTSQIEIRHGCTLESSEIERLVSVRAVAEVLARHGRR